VAGIPAKKMKERKQNLLKLENQLRAALSK
jgi:hypothetical protein